MAKLVVLMLGIMLILGAVACGGGSSPSTDSKSTSQRATGDSGKNVATSKPSPTPILAYTNTPTQPAAEPASTRTISAVDLVEEFNNNAVAATQKYSGLDLVVEGEVTAIDYDFLGNPYVAVGSEGLFEFQTVWCMVSDVSDVAGFSVGDKVTVEGTFSEWDMIDVILKPCAP